MANKTPPAVPKAKAIKPSKIILIVLKVKKYSACIVAPTEVAKNMVTILINSFWAVLDNLFTTILSLNRFPNISIPIMGTEAGNNRPIKTVEIIGKSILSDRDTGLSCFITIFLSSTVVNNFIIGG